ncbi:hypothetical protein LJC56_08635 [Christensenellaceae bacterium OttesenSCG-928-K19]|nr:hypothetical protein [Christensenellaceae bacterium OttesenSCG-928-K19]
MNKVNENSPKLDTQLMNSILKGDNFPVDEFDSDSFLTNDINDFFEELFSSAGMQKSEVIRKANIARTYGYQILNGTRIAERDYYLRIALAMSLDLRTTQRLLAVTQSGGLHSLIKRDAAIIFAINHGYDTERTYEFLLELGLLPLEKDDENDNENNDEPK